MSTLKDLTTVQYNEEDDLFFFESDHLALRGNSDYSELLKTLVILQSQRLQAIKDYEEVASLQKIASDDPVTFAERLKKGEKMVPDMFKVVEVPAVNWDKYNVKPPPHLLQQLEMEDASEENATMNADKLKQENIDTYNKGWSVDEQKRLEELLIKFPPEPIEMNRFKKIAAALGSRTAAQVTTRVQKYFLKLAKLGMPIPGRIPKAVGDKLKKCHPHQRFNHLLLRPSTFFPELDIPVKMDDTVMAPGPSTDTSNVNYDSTEEKSGNYLFPNTFPYLEQNSNSQSVEISKESEAKIRLNLLKQIRDIKSSEEKLEERNLFVHSEYTCDYCDDEPIIGTRWHCYTCDNSESVDFCTDCMISQIFSEESHNISHKFITIGAPFNCQAVNDKPLQLPSVSSQKLTSDSESSDVDSYQFDRPEQTYDSHQSDIDNKPAEENDSDSGSFDGNVQNYKMEHQSDDSSEDSNDRLGFNSFIKQENIE